MLHLKVRPAIKAVGERLAKSIRAVRRKASTFIDPGPEKDKKWDFFIGQAIRCMGLLRETLAIDEGTYLIAAGQIVADPRAYVVYSMLDEVAKGALRLMRMQEFLQSSTLESKAGVYERLINAHILEERDARVRRLLESLVVAILFSRTNEKAYYRHFLALELLEDELRVLHDSKEFWHSESRNLQSSAQMQINLIRELEPSIALERCWYLAQRAPIGDLDSLRPGRIMSSTRTRVKESLPLMTNNEKVLFGFTYASAYGRTSESVHFRADQADMGSLNDQDLSGLSHIGLLGFSILARCFALVGEPDLPEVRKLADMLEKTDPSSLVETATRRQIAVGDFVLAGGDLAEVLRITESPYGYLSYTVRYLAERPLPEIGEDSFPAMYVQLFYNRAQLFAQMKLMANAGKLPHDVVDKVGSLSNETMQEILRTTVTEVWGLGLGAWVKQNRRRKRSTD